MVRVWAGFVLSEVWSLVVIYPTFGSKKCNLPKLVRVRG